MTGRETEPIELGTNACLRPRAEPVAEDVVGSVPLWDSTFDHRALSSAAAPEDSAPRPPGRRQCGAGSLAGPISASGHRPLPSHDVLVRQPVSFTFSQTYLSPCRTAPPTPSGPGSEGAQQACVPRLPAPSQGLPGPEGAPHASATMKLATRRPPAPVASPRPAADPAVFNKPWRLTARPLSQLWPPVPEAVTLCTCPPSLPRPL